MKNKHDELTPELLRQAMELANEMSKCNPPTTWRTGFWKSDYDWRHRPGMTQAQWEQAMREPVGSISIVKTSERRKSSLAKMAKADVAISRGRILAAMLRRIKKRRDGVEER